jgi:hypothetical protein
MQVFNHGLHELTATPLGIEIFVTEDENPTTFAGPLGSNDKRSGMTEM